ncbi:hypothetical protein ACFL2U_03405 [Patescibacteria group bacterium]
MTKKTFILGLILSLTILAGCTGNNWQCEDFCGDGICTTDPCKDEYCPCPETSRTCDLDCK